MRVGQLVQSLNVLHLSGIYHGDARVYNAVLVGGQIVWIDFVYGDSEVVGHNGNRRKKKDMEALIISLYGPEKLLEERSRAWTSTAVWHRPERPAYWSLLGSLNRQRVVIAFK